MVGTDSLRKETVMTRSQARVFASAFVTVFLAASAAATAADSYQVDPIHSVIIFRIKHMDVGMFYGRFNGP